MRGLYLALMACLPAFSPDASARMPLSTKTTAKKTTATAV